MHLKLVVSILSSGDKVEICFSSIVSEMSPFSFTSASHFHCYSCWASASCSSRSVSRASCYISMLIICATWVICGWFGRIIRGYEAVSFVRVQYGMVGIYYITVPWEEVYVTRDLSMPFSNNLTVNNRTFRTIN